MRLRPALNSPAAERCWHDGQSGALSIIFRTLSVFGSVFLGHARPRHPRRLPARQTVRELAPLAALLTDSRAARPFLVADQPMVRVFSGVGFAGRRFIARTAHRATACLPAVNSNEREEPRCCRFLPMVTLASVLKLDRSGSHQPQVARLKPAGPKRPASTNSLPQSLRSPVVQDGNRSRNPRPRGRFGRRMLEAREIDLPTARPDVVLWNPVIVSFLRTGTPPPVGTPRSDGRTFAKVPRKGGHHP
jgi:hypothetical protein